MHLFEGGKLINYSQVNLAQNNSFENDYITKTKITLKALWW